MNSSFNENTSKNRVELAFEVFSELYKYSSENIDRELQEMLGNYLRRMNINPLFLSVCSYSKNQFEFPVSPAFSIGTNVLNLPIGSIFIEKSWKDSFSNDWKKFILLHEFAHIHYNHSPSKVLLDHINDLLPKDIRNAYSIIKIITNLRSLFLEGKFTRFFEEEITAVHEFNADNFSIQQLGTNMTAIQFFDWLKTQNITISHFSTIGDFKLIPALTIQDRINNALKYSQSTTP